MEMIKQLHLASQYLAAAGKSFLEHKTDDSHTNLEFSIQTKSLLTWPFEDSKTQLALNYETFSLDWIASQSESISLEGKTHKQLMKWLTAITKKSTLAKTYQYNLHYQLPYSLNEGEKFKLSSKTEVEDLIRLRTLAQKVISQFLKDEKLESTVRIWPHHFDTGAFAHLHDGSGKSVGLGMAIPDSMIDDLYFYIGGYRGHDSLNTWAFPQLSQGKWVNNGFKGAVLPASQTNEALALQFFKEAFKEYKS